MTGRLPYPGRLADVFRDHLILDGTGRLLDLGCGPGSLSLLLASSFDEVVAVDADADMIRVGQSAAAAGGIGNVAWRHECAEDLHDVGQFRVVTLAQSFHWMDRPIVADKIRGWVQPHGYCVHLGATTHEGTGATEGLPYPAPPRDHIRELVQAYLGPHRRAGRGVVAGGYTPDDKEGEFRAAGFVGPDIVMVSGGDIFERSEDRVIASVLSLSSASPHLFGDWLAAFLDDLRQLLREASPSGIFSKRAAPGHAAVRVAHPSPDIARAVTPQADRLAGTRPVMGWFAGRA